MNATVSTRHGLFLKVSSLALATSLSILSTSSLPDTAVDAPEFPKRLYLGIGTGASTLRPAPREPQILSVGDDSDIGVHLNLGYDVKRRLSVELFLASLGEAEIDRIDAGNEQANIDSIDYLIADISVIGYLLNSRKGLAGSSAKTGAFCREALSLYGRLGVGLMRNDDRDSNISHGRNYQSHITVGAGLEYGFRNGLGIRGEWTGFDSDARYLNISLLKRFGDNGCHPDSSGPPSPIPVPIPVPIPNPAPTPDPAPDPAPISAPMIHFEFDVATPDAGSLALLTTFAEQIAETDDNLHLSGHTDSFGSNAYNDELSRRRVENVRQILLDKRIDSSRITVSHHGEEQLINHDNTAAAHYGNRRVEIRREAR